MFAVVTNLPELQEVAGNILSRFGFAFEHLVLSIFELGKQVFS